MKISIIDEALPYPADSGKRLRSLHLLSRLSHRHEITYIAYGDTTSQVTADAVDHLHSLGIDTKLVHRPDSQRHGILFWTELGTNLFSKLPFSVTSHFSTLMQGFIKEHSQKYRCDLWHCEWTPYAEFFRKLDLSPLVIMAHNVESVIWQRYYETESNPIKRWYIYKQWQKFCNFERWAFRRADRVIAVSEQDAQRAKLSFGASCVDVVENGVDREFHKLDESQRRPHELLFLGSLDWRPNLDGIVCFLDQCLPAILARDPNVQLSIVGRNPPTWLRKRIEDIPAVQLYADVADVRPFLQRASIMIVPLRVGGGSRLKILEAAASGLTVASTKIGAEGLNLIGGVHFSEVNSVAELTQGVLELLSSPEVAKNMARKASQEVMAQYDWDVLAEKLDRIWSECVEMPVCV